MNKDLKIGLIFADDTEYVPFKKRMDKYEIRDEKKRNNEGCVITVRKADRTIEIHAVQSGIGKARAAAAAAFRAQSASFAGVCLPAVSATVRSILT